MIETTVRPATRDDLATLVAYNRGLARETEGRELDAATLAAGVRALLEDPRKGFYLVAERAGRVVGQLMVTYEWSDWRNGTFWWIQSVYVALDARRTGVYRALYDAVITAARAAGDVCGVRLYVEKANGPARQTYRALGMAAAVYDLYEVDFVLAHAPPH